jgi:putative ABC transport system permease protein
MERLRDDLRFAVRSLRRTPTFAITVLLILGLGIGMAVAMFTTVTEVLVRRLPVQDQDRVAVLWTYNTPTIEMSALGGDMPTIRHEVRTMRDVAGVVHWGAVRTPLLDRDHTLVLGLAYVTANYFDVLGARPALGRLLRPEDDAPGASPVVVLSHGLWQSQFGGSPSVIGRHLVDPWTRQSYAIIGVAPAGLDYPVGADCWKAMGTEVAGTVVLAVGRLAPGATLDAARAEFFSIVSRLQPGWKLTGATAETLTTAVAGNFRPILVAITSAAGLLLLIACVNIGTLFLVRAATRARELAVRRALGASYWDMVRQLIVESGLLAVAGGALGVACAAAMLRAFVAFAPPKMPHLDDVRLHGSLLGAAIGVTSIAVLLFGVVPALVAAQASAESSIRWDARSGRETRQRRTVRQWLVASQVALALVMLSGAGLLARSLLGLEQLRLGYQTAHLSILSLALDVSKYDSSAAIDPVVEQAEARIRAIPGVSAVTPILMPPFLGTNVWHPPFEAEGESAVPSGTYPDFPIEIAGPQYFRAFQIPIIRGRGFAESDRENAPPVVVVSQSVAHRFWPGQDPIGKRIRLPRASLGPGTAVQASDEPYLVWRTVVGVVPDTRFRTLRESSPMVYYPWQQYQSWQGIIAVRSIGDARGLAAAIQNTVKAIDPTIAVYGVRSMDELLGVPLAEPRLTALLLTAFGAVALLLAAVGLFGAMSSAVREQTREIGIRVALGATPAMIRGSVIRRAFVVISTGMAVGLAVALATTRVLGSLLYQVSPADPITLAFACAVLLVVAGVAAYLPARRATRIDPIAALRTD